MALQLNAPNFSGTAAFAGRGAGNLDLTVPGALGLQAIQLNQNREKNLIEAALQRQQLAQRQQQIRQQGELALRQQMMERDKLGLLSQQNAAELDLKRLGLDQQNRQNMTELDLKRLSLGLQDSQHKDELGLKRTGLEQQDSHFQDEKALKEAELFQRQQAMEMKNLLEEKKETLKEKGAFASYARLSMEKAQTPEEANQIRAEVLKEALDKGYVSKEEAASAAKSPLSTFKSMLEYKIMQYGKVNEYKSMLEANKPKDKSGVSLEVSPDGTIKYNQDPAAALKSEAQKDVKSKELALKQLEKVQQGYDPDYFTYKGQADLGASQFAQKAKGTPILESLSEVAASGLTGKSQEERAKFIENRSKYMNNVDQLFNAYRKEITGAAAGEKEMDMLKKSFLNGDMSPSQFTGALSQIVEKYNSESNFNKDILNKGLDITPKKETNTLFNQYRSDPRYKDWSDDKIQRALKMLNGGNNDE